MAYTAPIFMKITAIQFLWAFHILNFVQIRQKYKKCSKIVYMPADKLWLSWHPFYGTHICSRALYGHMLYRISPRSHQ